MSHRLCYISRNYRGVKSSGNKAKTDNEITLRQLGAHNLGLPTTYYNNKVLTFFLDFLGIIKMMLTVRSADIIVLQYPVKKYFSWICRVAHWRHAKIIALIHDLGSMRRKKLTVAQEIARLNHADYIIASNEKMEEWLHHHHLQRPTGTLQLFDYRSDRHSDKIYQSPGQAPIRLVYAGALAPRKNSFLLLLQQELRPGAQAHGSYQLDIYGNHQALPGLQSGESCTLHGFMDAEDFIAGVEGDMGLVWDGDSLDTCSGNFGEYLRWNSPHKVSFYLRAGLPIIIWREAALAPLVEQLGIGITIDNLHKLPLALNNLNTQQYAYMKKRVHKVSELLAQGQFLISATNTAVDQLTDS